MTEEEFDLLVAHNCAGHCPCDECLRIKWSSSQHPILKGWYYPIKFIEVKGILTCVTFNDESQYGKNTASIGRFVV